MPPETIVSPLRVFLAVVEKELLNSFPNDCRTDDHHASRDYRKDMMTNFYENYQEQH